MADFTQNQVTKPYYAEHFPKLEPYMVKDRVMKAYDIVPPVQWAKKSAQGRA